MTDSKKIAVALSGGVDSAATAYILKKQGYDVTAITLKLTESFVVQDAIDVARALNIEHIVVNLVDYFEQEVINTFVQAYSNGKTPNPCISCNKTIKYGKLLEITNEIGADFLALGHYARIEYNEKLKKYQLFKGVINRKDQSYLLYNLSQSKLSSVLLPLGKYTNKEEIRKIIRNLMPAISEKKDSNNICFIPDGNHGKFIRKKIGYKDIKGNFINREGKYLGKHKGIFYYTIGQKRGLGVKTNNSLCVIGIITEKNEIVLGEEKDLYRDEIILYDVNYLSNEYFEKEFNANIKLCQWGNLLKCTVYNLGNNIARIKFLKPERAPAPGQAGVLYIDEELIGGGIIK